MQVTLEDVTAGYYTGATVVGPVSFTIEGPGLYAITGPPGGGKSTLLAVLAGAHVPTGGTVWWDDTNIYADWDREELVRSTVGALVHTSTDTSDEVLEWPALVIADDLTTGLVPFLIREQGYELLDSARAEALVVVATLDPTLIELADATIELDPA